MIAALAVLIPFLLGAIFVYLRFRPEVNPSQKAAMRFFDGALLLMIVGIDTWIAFHFKITMGQSVDRAWWPALTVLSSLFLDTVILLAAALARAGVFKKR